MKNNVLITGGGLRNKGAQAMTFIVVSELRKRLPQLQPVLLSPFDCPPDLIDRARGLSSRDAAENLSFEIAYGDTPAARESLLGKKPATWKSAIRKVVRQRDIEHLERLYDDAACVIDISGYAFGRQWGFPASMSYLDGILLAKERNVPMYLMPQSFGPFDFEDPVNVLSLATKAADALQYPRIIFPREQAGFDALKKLCPSANLIKSSDLVLQSKPIVLENIFKNPANIPQHPTIATRHNVGIVPNARNSQHGNAQEIASLYHALVDKLLADDYNVYIIRHAEEDLPLCHDIKSAFMEESRVKVLPEDRYCFQYDELFSRCDFVIASRFHSIVHAYCCGTPCIALGWAAKYQELLTAFRQEEHAFDVTSEAFSEDAFFASVSFMEKSSDKLRPQILSTLRDIQKDDVLDMVESDLRSLGAI